MALIVVLSGVVLLYYVLNNGSSDSVITITATPPQTQIAQVTLTTKTIANQVTYDSTGTYAFPVAIDPSLLVWTHHHWDGTHAADIEARFGLTYPEFVRVTTAPLVAITNGLLVNYSGTIGGQGYMLHGDDGFDYYYAHMADQWVADGERVTVGQPLGLIGNSGNTAQFIEPHLHLAIGPRDTLWDEQPGVNGAEWIKTYFDLDWQERPPALVTYAVPQGAPVQHPDLAIITPYDQAEAAGLAQPAVELGFTANTRDTPLDIIATLSGEINVIRWTAHYGTRIQIGNPESGATVVISGVDDWLVTDGETVSAGDVIAKWNPANHSVLHYMIFQNGVIIDPTASLELTR